MSRIRITGGAWRSRQIQVIDAAGLRPTPDRVRETLFNWLGQDLTGWRCLDLFAGSGTLGFECASRGAAAVVLVEQSAKTLAQLRKSAATFASPVLQLEQRDALEFASALARQGRVFDLILLDPPYGHGWLDRVAPLLASIAAPEARIYAEAEYRIAALAGWQTIKQGQAGQVFYHLLER
jgi:16S rRNA (guanine966-N2)-methyltransferase